MEGRDLTAVMGTLGVDGARTRTNHVMETEKVPAPLLGLVEYPRL